LISSPTSATAGAPLTFSWQITGGGSVSHTAVHWGTSPGTPTDFRSYPNATPQFASINPADQAPKTYTVSFSAPQSGTIYYVIHAIVDGQNIYLAGGERTIQITSVTTTSRVTSTTAAPVANAAPAINPLLIGGGIAVVVIVFAATVLLRRRR